MAKLISNGHIDAYTYGVSFFYLVLEQIEDEKRETIQNEAISSRGAKSDKFDDFLKLFDKKSISSEKEAHDKNISMLDKEL